jgi:predicted PurR-regulated permease PerM
MSPIMSRIKTDILGYGALLLIIGVIIGTHLLSLCVFLIFVHLFTDVFTTTINRRFPRISKLALMIIFYVVLAGASVLVGMRVMPLFLADFSRYYTMIDKDVTRLLDVLSRKWGIDVDPGFLKQGLLEEGAKSLGEVFAAFNGVLKGVIYFIFALVLNFLWFAERKRIETVFTAQGSSLLTYVFRFVVRRMTTFYVHFRTVMGGQVIISAINTAITFVAMLVLGLPHKTSLTCIIFLCGLLPVVGNLVSNTILTITAFLTTGPLAAGICLGLLVVIHKLEYFLNSKIIGTIVRLPMFVTLLSLLLGEAVLGVIGMIIAVPFVLTLKDELEDIAAQRASESAPDAAA